MAFGAFAALDHSVSRTHGRRSSGGSTAWRELCNGRKCTQEPRCRPDHGRTCARLGWHTTIVRQLRPAAGVFFWRTGGDGEADCRDDRAWVVQGRTAARKSPDNLDAWHCYQRGLWHLWRFTTPGF